MTVDKTDLAPYGPDPVGFNPLVPALSLIHIQMCIRDRCNRATLLSGASSPIVITTTAPAIVPPAGLASSNTAAISSATYDGVSPNNSNTVNFNINPLQADLSLTKNKTPNPVAQGSNMTSTIVLHNNGPLAATSPIRVTDQLAAGETFVSATGTNWSCSEAGGVVTCS